MAAWLQNTAFHKKLNPIATFLVSSRTGTGCSFSVYDCCGASSLSLSTSQWASQNCNSCPSVPNVLQGWAWQTS